MRPIPTPRRPSPLTPRTFEHLAGGRFIVWRRRSRGWRGVLLVGASFFDVEVRTNPRRPPRVTGPLLTYLRASSMVAMELRRRGTRVNRTALADLVLLAEYHAPGLAHLAPDTTRTIAA